MKVLQQCMYFPPEVGGLESHCYYLCKELVRLGDDVTMITSRSKPESPEHETMDGVNVVRTWFPGKTPAGWISHTMASIPTYMPYAKRAHVLHAQDFASGPPAMLAKSMYGLPLVMTLHTSHFLKVAKKPVWKPILVSILKSADWLLAASDELRDTALALYPHPRAESVTNGVDTTMFRRVAATLPANPAVRRVIVPRRLHEKNGVEYFVRAMPLIRRHIPVEALLVGDGPEREKLEALAAELGVKDSVTFMGSRPNTEMPGLFASAEIAILPSLMEATSVAALEAMSCGIPVAASNVGGLPEIIDETVGTLFRPADPEDLAEKLVALMNRGDRAETGARARSRVVDHWSLERLARRHQAIYQDLVQRKS